MYTRTLHSHMDRYTCMQYIHRHRMALGGCAGGTNIGVERPNVVLYTLGGPRGSWLSPPFVSLLPFHLLPPHRLPKPPLFSPLAFAALSPWIESLRLGFCPPPSFPPHLCCPSFFFTLTISPNRPKQKTF